MSTEKTVTPFTFNWAAEPEGFLKWFLPTVLGGMLNDGFMEDLTQRTNTYKDVQVQVLINGLEVDAKHFLESVERNLELEAAKEARRMLNDVGGLEALEQRIGEIRAVLVAKVEEALAERGIELPGDDW